MSRQTYTTQSQLAVVRAGVVRTDGDSMANDDVEST